MGAKIKNAGKLSWDRFQSVCNVFSGAFFQEIIPGVSPRRAGAVRSVHVSVEDNRP